MKYVAPGHEDGSRLSIIDVNEEHSHCKRWRESVRACRRERPHHVPSHSQASEDAEVLAQDTVGG